MAHDSLIGIDLGGTKGIVARYDASTLACEELVRIPTRGTAGFLEVLSDIADAVNTMKNEGTRGIGIGVPGLVRQPEGVLLHAPNIQNGNDVDVKAILSKAIGLPVMVDNDANCFALAEAIAGEGKGKSVAIGITMGTGVGGGIVIDGKLFRGSHGYAAEVGHMLLMPGAPPFETQDKRGEVEQFFSGTAMGKRCVQAERPEDYLEGQVCSFLQPHIFREVAWLCTSLTYLLDPDVIIFGGSAGIALRPHLDTIKKELRQWSLKDTPLPELAIGTVKDAGAVGAALLARTK